MDAALGRLLLMRMRGGARHRIARLANLRGVLFLLVVAGIAWLILAGGGLAPGHQAGRVSFGDAGDLRAHVVDFMPLGLLGACLFTLFASPGPALHFSQTEINLLFAGPFSRRSLVLYKICAYVAGAFLSAAIFTLLIPRQASSGLAAFAGSFLTLLFIQLSTAAFKTLGHVFAGGPLMRVRQPLLALAVAASAASLVYATAVADANVIDILRDIGHSPLGSVLLAPFAVFARVFLAQEPFPDLLVWAGAATAINLALLFVVVLLYGRAAEQTLSESQQLSRRWARMRQGASYWASGKTTSRSLRRAPALGGVGPVAWRQAINAVRNTGRILLVFFAIAAIAGPVVANAAASTISAIVGLLYFFLAFIVPRSLVCDFRGDLASIELYKALPVAPWRIAAGQLTVPVVVTTALQLVMIVSTLPFVDGRAVTILVALAAFTVPASLLLYGLENLIFLLFPTRLLPMGRVDFEFLGRSLVDFMAKTILITLAAAAAGAAGYGMHNASGGSWMLGASAAWFTLSAIAILTVPLLGWAFQRFRVSETIA